MALVIAQADARSIARNVPEQEGDKFALFDFRDNPDLPHATLNGHTGDRIGPAHFHERDQFQVVVDGKCKIGRHELSPYCVHFARANTPYGPLVPLGENGDYTFVVMRAHRDFGSQVLPEQRDRLLQVASRRPFQITCPVNFPEPEGGSNDVALQPIPGLRDNSGLAGYTWILKSNVKATAPDPSHGDGQYILIVRGSLWDGNKERKALTLVFVGKDERAYKIQAGAGGLDAIVLNFPQIELHKETIKA